jgi:hypothetical protein
MDNNETLLTELKIRENSLASVFEISELINLLNELDTDEPLAYSITSKMIDFISEHYYNKEKADPKAIEYLVNLYKSKHMHIREKINKAIMKLMNKNYKEIRRALIIEYDKDLPDYARKEMDSMLSTVYSGIYFDYSSINEAKKELQEMSDGEEE